MIVQEQIKYAWKQSGSLLAFPYGWQQPAKTEEWVYETIIQNKLESRYVEYICFPWATLVDLINRGKVEEAQFYLNAIDRAPVRKSLIRVTAFQHVDIEPVVEIFKLLKINKIYWAHKKVGQDSYKDCLLGPLPLYPWAFLQQKKTDLKVFNERPYFLSFIGTNASSYMSGIRNQIFNAKLPKSFIKQRSEWHFEGDVYQAQINGDQLNLDYLAKKNIEAKEYIEVLSNTKMSLCPSGMGPNTIRYWESLAFGCIPIVLSDLFDKPKISDRWHEIKVLEKDFQHVIHEMDNLWGSSYSQCYQGNPIVDFHDLTSDWLNEAVFDVFKRDTIKSIYESSKI